MSVIKILSTDQAHKIAAGEVIERPASIVKELLENSIDAGATTITIFVQEGGKDLIRVVDNGCGMDQQDAQLCFTKHATSKISSFDQLSTIKSFGFRGEALTSIAATARVVLITKTSSNNQATRIEIENSSINRVEETAHPVGTDISVYNLFEHLPARKKFLKKRETEQRAICHLVHAFCLAYPTIHFRLISQQKELYNFPAADSLRDRCNQIFDHEQAAHFIPVHHTLQAHPIHLEGTICNHQVSRFDREGIFLLVNNRWVKNQHLLRAVLKGYNNVLPPGKYPIACLKINIDPQEVDINIHPRKEEVCFLHPRVVEHAVEQLVRSTLEQHLSMQLKKTVSFPLPPTPAIAQQYIPSLSFQPFNFDAAVTAHLHRIVPQTTTTDIAPVPVNPPETPATLPVISYVPDEENYRIIGQYQSTYILLEKDDGLLLIDQHAAHERILYEQFANRFESIATITLLFAHTIQLSCESIAMITPHLSLLREYGIVAEPFGAQQLRITATPVHLKSANMQELIEAFVQDIHTTDHTDSEHVMKLLHEKLRAQMACKAAVKAGDTLSIEQMNQLVVDLHKTANRFSCPHGRPTSWLLSLHEIEKKFKRKL